jgi:hypothetical protein
MSAMARNVASTARVADGRLTAESRARRAAAKTSECC